MKLKVFMLTVTALFLLLSFSPWEGAAGVAPEGELPAAGFFIATNSFPRNTVVDVTNLETGKTTRAIVANTLTNPGLLAIVSRDAANLIGMRSGSISRIRILSPSDPIAYQRFTEGLAQEMPPFDSGNVIKSEQQLLSEVYGQDSFIPGSSQTTPAADSEFRGPSYLMEPEWGGTARLEIVDIPRYVEPPSRPITQPPPQVPPVQVVQPPPQVQEPPVQVEPQVQQPPVQVVIREPEIELQGDVVKDVPAYITEQSTQDIDKKTEGFFAETAQADVVKDVPAFPYDSNYNEIVKDVPGYINDSVFSEVAKSVEGFIIEGVPAEIAKDVPRYVTDSPVYPSIAKDVPEFVPDTFHSSVAKDVPEYITESQFYEIAKSVEGFNTEGQNDEIVKDVERFSYDSLADSSVKDVERFITGLTNEVPAKYLDPFVTAQTAEEIAKDVGRFDSERLAEEVAKDVDRFISGLTNEELAKYVEGFFPEQTLDELAKSVSQFDPLKPAPGPGPVPGPIPHDPAEPGSQSEFNIVVARERSPSGADLYGIDPNYIIPGIAPAVTERPRAPQASRSFSIRSINSLDRGQYYVQIASLPENLVENTIRQFDPQFFSYNPVVFRDRDDLYRILIGPLNQGESAAVLARFKSIGYRDALVRRGG